MIRRTPFRKINMIAGGEFHLLRDKMSRRRQPFSPRTLARAQLRQNHTVSLLAAGLMVLGGVFLCVTGAEALYAEPMAAGEGPSTTPRRSGLVRCPRRRRPSGPHLAFAPSAPRPAERIRRRSVAAVPLRPVDRHLETFPHVSLRAIRNWRVASLLQYCEITSTTRMVVGSTSTTRFCATVYLMALASGAVASALSGRK
jgi:hypothetical protein